MKKKYIGLICLLRITALTAVIMLVLSACGGGDEEIVDNSKFYFDPPTEITATLLSNNTTHITWNAVPNAGHYEISVRTNLDSEDTRRNVGTSSRTSYEHYNWYYVTTGVTTLYYYIKTHPSKSGYIASGWSAPVSVIVR